MIRFSRHTFIVGLFGGLLSFAIAVGATPVDRVGERLSDVTLRTLDGKDVSLLSLHTERILVVAYTGVGCPIAGRYAPRLEKLYKKYGSRGVRFVGINANPQDSAAKIRKEMEELGVTFPVLMDRDQALTRQLDAKTTTEVFVIDESKVIRYRGAVDDQYNIGAQRRSAKTKYLELAIKDVLKDRDPFTTRTAAPGCLITRVKPVKSSQDITYSSHVARIVQDNCQKCHRKGQIAPFPLTTYEEARGWSAMIHSVLEEGRMPPWNAAHSLDGVFLNERLMPEADKKALLAWIDNGTPRGNPDEDPPTKSWPRGWRIGKPDKIYKMGKAFSVPAEGVVEYKYFTIRTTFRKDKWIQAMEVKAGAEDVVHHIVVMVAEPGQGGRPQGNGIDDGFLCATVPGDIPSIFLPGMAKKLPAGADLIFQVHYTTNGKKRRDQSSVGMIFTDEPVEKEVSSRGIANMGLKVPAGADNHEVRAEYTFLRDTDLLSMYPHMHFRGKSWKFVAHYPDGREETLLDVPRYDYNWQESYILRVPKRMPAGTTLECIAHYDNSAANFVNPDPTIDVRWGEQSWEEMMIGYFDYVTP